MGEFLEHEKNRQVLFLRESGYFSLNLSTFTENPQRLPAGIASENLCPAIRLRAIDYFEINHIHWPRGNFYSPSPDLCDVTVNCVNYFFPFSNSPTALRNLLSLVYPTIKNMLPFPDGSYVAFLWPEADQEQCADAAVYFLRKDFSKQLVLINWNYCETYSQNPLVADQKLEQLFDYNLPINTEKLNKLDPLLYQPFYRYLALQILASQLELERYLENDLVTVLNVMPFKNKDLLKVVSPELTQFGLSPSQVWQNLVKPYDRFATVFTENLFGHFDISHHPELLEWWLYITRRYPWLNNK
ncbi:MAG: PGN_0703 family putative restriction endonuclease [Anaerolineaceae bacterium]